MPATRQMERLMIDLIDMSQYKLDDEGFAWIMSVLDVFSKFAWAIPLKNKSGLEFSQRLKELFLRHTGPPKILQSDNGKEFKNKNMEELQKEFKFVIKNSRPRHPQSQGQVDRFNQTLTRYLQKFIFEKQSDENSTKKIGSIL
jgi:transposase InsO family protein